MLAVVISGWCTLGFGFNDLEWDALYDWFPAPVVKDGALAVGSRLAATLSADHRATDGAEAARYLQSFRRYLEAPLRLLL